MPVPSALAKVDVVRFGSVLLATVTLDVLTEDQTTAAV